MDEETITLRKEGLSYKLIQEEKDCSDDFENPIPPLIMYLAKKYNAINSSFKKLTVVLDGFNIEGGTRVFKIKRINYNTYCISRIVRCKGKKSEYEVGRSHFIIILLLNLFSEFLLEERSLLEEGQQVVSAEKTNIEIEFDC